MNISLNWLRDYVEWTGTNDELVDLLTSTGLEVASVTTRGADFPKVVIARILESTQHPNADRLSVTKVDDGSGIPRQIVCGAKNYKVGDIVPCALPGAVLPGDFKIKVGKLRGVESEGMLCSAKELRLAEDSDGLLILPQDAPIGQPVSVLFPADTILEVEVTPNRGDWLSHVGIAREIAAFTKKAVTFVRPEAPATREAADVARIDDAACSFYSLRKISNVKVGPSPQWLSQRLEAVGLRSINNIVDVTNYVMLEMGQPLHAFDAAKVSGGIVVRSANAGEKFLALDGREYTLAPGQLVIADGTRALALGGVMGGEGSGVAATTTDILLEAAIFQTSSIRKTARDLTLHSDSSYRFERGVDPQGVLAAAARATQLILEIAGGEAGDTVVAGALPAANAPVRLSHRRCSKLLGIALTADEIRGALQGLGLTLVSEDADSSTWNIPSHRLDLPREVDLIEEVARVVGIGRIKGRIAASPATPGAADANYDDNMALRNKLVALGLSEARTSTLIKLPEGEALRLRNPLGEDQAALRTSLIPGLLGAVERNIRQGAKRIGLFEIGQTFHPQAREERAFVAIVLTGRGNEENWRGEKARVLDWHDAKGVVETIAGTPIEWVKGEAVAPFALSARILADGEDVGFMGQLSPTAARDLDTKNPVLAIEIDLGVLRAKGVGKSFSGISKFPSVARDMAIVAPLAMTYGEIEKELLGAGDALLAEVTPFDVFADPSGGKLPADKKSLAISLTFRASDRTLTGEEVQKAFDRLKQGLREKLAVDFRE